MQALIPGLCGSPTHQMSAELYRRHHDSGSGTCDTCGHRAPCPVRRRALAVIFAAGEDPLLYDAQCSNARAPVNGTGHGEEECRQLRPGTATRSLTYVGYHVGGRGRPVSYDGLSYDRDD